MIPGARVRLLPPVCALSSVFCALLYLSGAGAATAQQPSQAASSATDSKAKKIWTNDDLGTAAPRTAAAGKTAATSAPATSAANVQLAAQLRGKLEKVQRQLKDTESELEKLRRFAAGESSGDAARQWNKGYNRTPIAEQIAKLEEKRKRLQEQIEAIYDEARKKGILPGQLRSS